MPGEHYVEYYGAIFAVLLSLAPIVNGIFGRSLSGFNAVFTAKRRMAEVDRMLMFFTNIQKARSSDQQRQTGFTYSICLVTKGWSRVVQGTVIYILAIGLLILDLKDFQLSANDTQKLVSEDLLIFAVSTFFIGMALFVTLGGQKDIRRGLDLRDGLAANPKFLDRATKRLLKITATKLVDVGRLQMVREQIEDARRYHGVDWLHIKL